MIDVLHLIQLSLLRFSELASPVFVKQLAGPLDVDLRRPECNDFLRPGSAGKKLDDFAQRGEVPSPSCCKPRSMISSSFALCASNRRASWSGGSMITCMSEC